MARLRSHTLRGRGVMGATASLGLSSSYRRARAKSPEPRPVFSSRGRWDLRDFKPWSGLAAAYREVVARGSLPGSLYVNVLVATWSLTDHLAIILTSQADMPGSSEASS